MDTNAYIEILDSTNSVLGSIPVGDNSDFPLVLTDSISNIENIFERTSSFSKSARFNADRATNQLLEQLWNSNVYDNKDMKNLKSCRLIVNGLQYVNFNKIKITDVVSKLGQPQEYEYILYGENFEWVEQLKSVYLKDLDYGYYVGTTFIDDVQYNRTDMLAVMATDYDDNYDYWWSLKNFGGWSVAGVVSVEDFRPDIYYRSIIEKAFKSIGYTIESTFITGSIFKKILFPVLGKQFKHTQTNIDNCQVLATNNSAQIVTNTGNMSISANAQFTNETLDPSNAWSGDTFTAPVAGIYKIKGTLDFSLVAPNGSNYFINHLVNGVQNQMYDINGVQLVYGVAVGVWTPYLIDFESDIILQAGQTYSVQIDLPYFGLNQIFKFRLNPTSSISISLQEKLIDGSKFKIKDVVDQSKTCLDVISDMADLFNLRFKTDTQLKKVYIDTHENFYKPKSQAIDLTYNLDTNEPYTLSFITNYNRDWVYGYAIDNNDKVVKRYKEINGKDLGALEVSLPSRFAKGNQRAGAKKLAATSHTVDSTISQNNGVYMPFMSNNYPILANPSYEFDARALYQLGYTNHNSCDWNFYSPKDGTTTNQTLAPIAFMQDTLLGQGINLSFDDHAIAGDGLFRVYWDETFQMIETGIILNAKIKLKPTQTALIDLRYPVYFDAPLELKGYWIIDTLGEYSPNNLDTIPIKLIKYTSYSKKTTTEDDASNSGNTNGLEGPVLGAGNGVDSSNAKYNGGDTPSTVLNNNTGNQAERNSGSVVMGQGLVSQGRFQTVIGKYNAPNDTDIFQIGGGTGPNDRVNVFSIDKDGNFSFSDNPIFIEDENGNYIQVVTKRNNTIAYVYKRS